MNTFDHDCNENHETLWKSTKNYKNIDIFDHDCNENHDKLWKMIKNDKNDKTIDIFEYDCSENHEIMVVLMDLEAETLSEWRFFNAAPAHIGFGSRLLLNVWIVWPRKGRK